MRSRLFILAAGLVAAVLMSPIGGASAQTAGLPASAAGPSPIAPTASDQGPAIFSPRERAPVALEGRVLFEIGPSADLSARDRADLISERLLEAAKTMAQGHRARAAERSGKSGIWLDGAFLLWVGQDDGGGGNPSEVAETWADTIEGALERYRIEHSSGYLRHAGLLALGAAAVAVAIHLLLWFVYQVKLGRPDYRASLEARLGERRAAWTLVQLEAIWIVRFLWLALWLGWAFYVASLFPQTRVYLTVLVTNVVSPIGRFFAVIGLTLVAILVGNRLIEAGLAVLERRLAARLGPGGRFERRAITLARAAKATLDVLLILTGLLVGLARAGVNVNAILAAAGLTSLAIGLGAQSLIKDVISGFFILIEDQFAVGDVIQIGEEGGVVERMSLRVTRMRNSEGTLITVPNGQIGLVKNLTSEWSRVDLKIPVAYATNLGRAMEVSKEVADRLWREWPDRILEEPVMLGVDEYGQTEIWLRLWIKTAPFKRWEVMREMRLRLKVAFDEAGIEIPFARRALFHGIAAETPQRKDP